MSQNDSFRYSNGKKILIRKSINIFARFTSMSERRTNEKEEEQKENNVK
jgi:hypothetical protein